MKSRKPDNCKLCRKRILRRSHDVRLCYPCRYRTTASQRHTREHARKPEYWFPAVRPDGWDENLARLQERAAAGLPLFDDRRR